MPAIAQSVPADTLAAVKLRPADSTLAAAFRGDPDFNYQGEIAEGESLLSLAWDWFVETILAPLLTNGQGDFRWPVYLLMAMGVGYAVLKLLRIEGKSVVFGRGQRATINVEEIEDLAPLDLKAMLDEAMARQAYREALRLYYLRLLQRMAEERLIVWHPEKTNAEYVHEVEVWQHREAFRDLTALYDYVWYGDFPVEVERFDTLRHAFEQFFAQIEAQPA
ncbi:MAG: DUF4129 domain-containing protein [Bacteroidota bacterium]